MTTCHIHSLLAMEWGGGGTAFSSHHRTLWEGKKRWGDHPSTEHTVICRRCILMSQPPTLPVRWVSSRIERKERKGKKKKGLFCICRAFRILPWIRRPDLERGYCRACMYDPRIHPQTAHILPIYYLCVKGHRRILGLICPPRNSAHPRSSVASGMGENLERCG
jgi:hypothetical protein